MVGTAQKHRTFQHKDLKLFLEKHQSIAILPFQVLIERNNERSDDTLAYSLRLEAQQESTNIPLTCTLLWAGKANEHTARLKSWDKTRQILNKSKFQPTENILADSLRKIAQALQVDALLLGYVHAYEDKYSTNYGKTHVASEDVITVNLFIYDGEKGELIWQNEDSSAYSLRLEERLSLGKNVEIVLSRMFQLIPYFKSKKKKK